MGADEHIKSIGRKVFAELVTVLPEDIFAAEAARRGYVPPTAVGSLATTAALKAEVVHVPADFKHRVNEFIASDKRSDVHEQLTTMHDFWLVLGKSVPALNEEQYARIQLKLNEYSDRRIVPVPLLSLAGHDAIIKSAKRVFFNNATSAADKDLSIPDESLAYGQHIRNPDAIVRDDHEKFALRYVTNDGVLSRSAFIDKLINTGQAVTAEDGIVWIFPVMDVGINSQRQYARAGELHAKADSTQTTDSLIVKQLLHQAGGISNSQWCIDITNEAVYEIDNNGRAVEAVQIGTVYWDTDDSQLCRTDWPASARNKRFGISASESGL